VIGNQVWLRENLNIGTRISTSLPQNNDYIVEKYCYDGQDSNGVKYGGLYQWGEAMQKFIMGARGICPAGWRIPSKADVDVLSATVDADGCALKERGEPGWVFWNNYTGTNTSGFSGLLAGMVNYSSHTSSGMKDIGRFWLSEEIIFDPNTSHGVYFELSKLHGGVGTLGRSKLDALSVRCIMSPSSDGGLKKITVKTLE